MSEWPSVTIGELIEQGAIEIHKDGNHGGNYPRVEDFGLSGLPFLTAKSLDGWKVDIDGAPKLSELKAKSFKFGFVEEGDVLLSHNATVGRVAVMPKIVGRVVIGTSLTQFRTNKAVLNPRFLAIYFSGREFQNQLSFVMAQSTRNQVPITSQRRLSIPIAPLQLQADIADTIFAFNDKIELNRQMNQTLEAMARAVFLDWFVDFGPTRRKAAGITDPAAILGHLIPNPTQSTSLAALFPDRFGANGLPMGWEVRVVSDDFDVEMGQSPPSSTYNETGNGLPFFQGRRDFQFRFPEKRVYCSAPTRTAEADWTLISVRAPVGDINRAWEKCCIGRGVGAMMHKKGLASFTYYVALHLQEELASYDKDGTVFGSINQKQIKGLSVNATNSKAAKAYDEVIVPIDEMIRNNTEENQTLAATRDLLLPKLMSGELRLMQGDGGA